MQKLSRRKLAEYVASQVTHGVIPEAALQEVAAYLYESRRLREVTLVVRSIEDALSQKGVTVATVTSARPLDERLRAIITNQIGSDEVHLREVVDPTVIGGVRLQTPDAAYDATLAHKLNGLRAAKL